MNTIVILLNQTSKELKVFESQHYRYISRTLMVLFIRIQYKIISNITEIAQISLTNLLFGPEYNTF